jgi:hypothetical protein
MTTCTVVEEVTCWEDLQPEEQRAWTEYTLPENYAQFPELIITPTLLYNTARDTFLRVNGQYTVPDAKPRKPAPALPVEVYSSKQFDKDAAWAAIVALSRGS